MTETLHFPRVEPWTQEHLTLIFDKRLPDHVAKGTLADERHVRDYYESEGREIANALLRHLPGGLIDGLLVALLDHKRSLFRVPHVQEGGAG